MADTWQLLLHFSRSAMLHHTLFGIGWITYRIGWIRSKLAGLWQETGQRSDCFYCIFTRSGAASYFLHLETSRRKCGAFIWETFWEKKLVVFESASPIRGYQGCVSYNLLFSTFSLKGSSWVQTNHLLEVSILSHTPNHPCLLWQLACCCLSPKPWVDHFAQQSEGSDGVGCCISTFQWNLHWIVLRCNAVDLLDYFNRMGIGSF